MARATAISCRRWMVHTVKKAPTTRAEMAYRNVWMRSSVSVSAAYPGDPSNESSRGTAAVPVPAEAAARSRSAPSASASATAVASS